MILYSIINENVEIKLKSIDELSNMSNKENVIMIKVTYMLEKELDIELNEFINLEKLLIYCNDNLICLPKLDKLSKLTYLDCYENNLEGTLCLEGLASLKYIKCSFNKLENLSDDITHLSNLEQLICNNNKLIELPNLDSCINLKKLYCHYNKLTTFPSFKNLHLLESFECIFNNTNSLPISILFCEYIIPYRVINIKNRNRKYIGYQYNENIPQLVNLQIEKYYYIPILEFYNDIYFSLGEMI